MGSSLKTLKSAIKGQDLFGVPVQLTYKGQTAFNTVLGGCLSILLAVVFAVYFAFAFKQLYLHPDYLSTPYRLSFGERNITVPASQGMIAVRLVAQVDGEIPD